MGWTLVDSWTHSGNVDEVEFTGLGDYKEILIKCVGVAAGDDLKVRFSDDALDTTKTSGYQSGSGAVDQTFWRISLTTSLSPNSWAMVSDFNVSGQPKMMQTPGDSAVASIFTGTTALDSLVIYAGLASFPFPAPQITAGTIEIWGRTEAEPIWEEIDSWEHSVDVSEVIFTGLGGYEAIMITAEDVATSAIAFLRFQASSNNGSSYHATSGDYVAGTTSAINREYGTVTSSSSSAARYAQVIIRLWDKSSGKVMYAPCRGTIGNEAHRMSVASAMNALRVFCSAGNMTSGKIRIFGISGANDGFRNRLASWDYSTGVQEVNLTGISPGSSRLIIKGTGLDTDVSDGVEARVSDDDGASYYSGAQYYFGGAGTTTTDSLILGAATSSPRHFWMEIHLPNSPPPFAVKQGTTISGIAISGEIDAIKAFVEGSTLFAAGKIEIFGLSDSESTALLVDRFANAQSFHQPTVSPGEVSAAPSLFANQQTFRTQVVGVGLKPSLFSNAQTFFSQVIGTNLQPILFQNQQVFPAQTVVHIPNQFVQPGLFTNAHVFHQHVRGGLNTLAVAKHDNAQVFPEHEAGNAIIVEMPLLALESRFYLQEVFQPARRDPTWNNYYCARTGFKVPYDRLVPDGEIEGMYVEKGWEDDPHPQKYPRPVSGDEITQANPPPSQDPNDEYEPVKLIIDGDEYNV